MISSKIDNRFYLIIHGSFDIIRLNKMFSEFLAQTVLVQTKQMEFPLRQGRKLFEKRAGTLVLFS